MRAAAKAGFVVVALCAFTMTRPGDLTAQTTKTPKKSGQDSTTSTQTKGSLKQDGVEVKSFQFGVQAPVDNASGKGTVVGKRSQSVVPPLNGSNVPAVSVYKGPVAVLPPNTGTQKPNDSAHHHPKH
jgi:hypothetical protein